MSPESLFSLSSALVLPGWLLLAVAPRWRWTTRIAATVLPMMLAGVYICALAPRFWTAEGGFGSLAQVAALFADPHLLLAGWVHYLAFDLFVGAWEVRDSRRHSVPHLLVVPCLALTFLFGPVGWLAYVVLRTALRRQLFLGGERESQTVAG